MTDLFNRELSEVEYQARVLAMAEDASCPSLTRAWVLGIYASNIDEFFQVRVARLKREVASGADPAADGQARAAVLQSLRSRLSDLADQHARLFALEIGPQLAKEGVEIVGWDDLTDAQRATLSRDFAQQIAPVLTPLTVDPARPFPFISDLSLNLAVIAIDPVNGARRFSRVKVPNSLDRFVSIPDEGCKLIPLEAVIAAHLERLLPGLDIISRHVFRITRDADYTVGDDVGEDLVEMLESELHRRRFGAVVRLEIPHDMPDEALQCLRDELDIDDGDIYRIEGLQRLDDLLELQALDRPDLKRAPWTPVNVAALETNDPDQMFARLRESDLIVHHPYESFDSSTQRFISLAADDPHVLAIKQTVYRTSGDSPIVAALMRAVANGKQAVALVELKARFDEQANIAWAQELEAAGVHVVYGFVDIKTHTKTALVVRREGDKLVRYGHVGSGNYNPSTAKGYEDFGLFTTDPEITADLSDLFNFLTGHNRLDTYRRLLVAPVTLRARLLELIAQQGRPGGMIQIKANNVTDPTMIEALCAASQQGAQIDLIIRGICCLRPGVKGVSENVRVRSIVGGFLEHSRIYRFGQHPDSGAYLIGSADLMPRNLDRRVEAVVPVDDETLRARLDEVLELCLADDTLAWTLAADGTWSRLDGGTHNVQETLKARARQRRQDDIHALRVTPPLPYSDASPTTS